MSSNTEHLNLKVLRADKVALRRLAAVEGEPISVVVRRVLRDELKRRGLLEPATLRSENHQGEEGQYQAGEEVRNGE
jgi:hypothetical protein